MKGSRRWTYISFGILVFLSLTFYWYYFAEPDPFPTSEQLLSEMNSIYPEAAARHIQDTIYADDCHVLVPFISEKNDYGLSYWVWKMNKWTLAMTNSKGNPMVWKVDPSDPESYRIVWNIHPDDQVSSVDYYLIRGMGYQVTEGEEHYKPGIQLMKNVSMEEKPYGMIKLPGEWVTVMSSIEKVESNQQSLFNNPFPDPNMYMGWLPYDQANADTFPERSVNGNSYSIVEEVIEYMSILNQNDIEVPK